jgi:hypothetical protein
MNDGYITIYDAHPALMVPSLKLSPQFWSDLEKYGSSFALSLSFTVEMDAVPSMHAGLSEF